VAPKVTDAKVGTTIVIDKTLNKLSLYQGFTARPQLLGRDRHGAVRDAQRHVDDREQGHEPHVDESGPRHVGRRGSRSRSHRVPATRWVTRALYLNAPGIRIHGTYDSASIGTHASHGCVRMNIDDVEEMYPLVPIGATVLIF
jgi:hypothetical protein